MLLWNLRKGCF